MRTTAMELLQSSEPAVRYRAAALLADPAAPALRAEIARSPLAAALLSEQAAGGTIPHHPYRKWTGAHWVLYSLAELGYPPGDERLIPLREAVYGWLLSPQRGQTAVLDGRARFCASMEGNALWYLCRLGLADERAARLADRLVQHAWPDGGWNCDMKPLANHSSFHETLSPMRGLAAWAGFSGDPAARAAAERAAGVFLEHRLLFRRSDGELISPSFAGLYFPSYWHYSLLAALTALGELGCLSDPRCADALHRLEARRLPDGGFPRDRGFDQHTRPQVSGYTPAHWGPSGLRRANPFVTLDALRVLQVAGRS